MKTTTKDTLKRLIGVILTIVLFVIYYITTDPDSHIIKNMKYGVGLILTLQVFFMAMLGIIIIEFFPDFFVDIIYGDEKELRKKACETSRGASLALIAKSIRILSFAIIMAASIVAFAKY